jgi:hypothetical protein
MQNPAMAYGSSLGHFALDVVDQGGKARLAVHFGGGLKHEGHKKEGHETYMA